MARWPARPGRSPLSGSQQSVYSECNVDPDAITTAALVTLET